MTRKNSYRKQRAGKIRLCLKNYDFVVSLLQTLLSGTILHDYYVSEFTVARIDKIEEERISTARLTSSYFFTRCTRRLYTFCGGSHQHGLIPLQSLLHAFQQSQKGENHALRTRHEFSAVGSQDTVPSSRLHPSFFKLRNMFMEHIENGRHGYAGSGYAVAVAGENQSLNRQ